MRSYEVFAKMRPERAVQLMRSLAEHSPGIFRQFVDTAAIASKARPVYLRRQPFEKRAEAVRRTLARVVANTAADELLAVYFLECRKELLVEWLNTAGIAHDDGTLEQDEPTQPPADALGKSVEAFRTQDGDADRELLLCAFAAQQAVDWPALDTLLDAAG